MTHMRSRIDTLTDADRELFRAVRDEWIANAMNTAPLTAAEFEGAGQAVRDLYRLSKIESDPQIVYCADPVCAAIAACIASAWWYLYDQGEDTGALDAAAQRAVAVACGVCPPPATWQATEQATEQATWQATSQATSQATWQATSQATEQATRQATEQATSQATSQATWQATWQATEQATRQATRQATEQAISADHAVALMLACCGRWDRFWFGGSCWSGWASFYDAFQRIGLDIDWAPLAPNRALCRVGPTMLHRRFAIVSDRATNVSRDAENRPHSANGPAILWRTGRALYYWHGTRVPGEWIESPQTLDPVAALTRENIEQRRAAAEIVGWDRILATLPHRVIDTDPDPQIGTLIEVDLPDSPRERFLRVVCGTGRTFCLPTAPEARTARQAQALSYGLPIDTPYILEIRT